MAQPSECPRCGDASVASALEPHACGVWQPPRAELLHPRLRWDGAHLVVDTDSPIPAGACWLCGASAAVRQRRRRFSYAPPWVYLTALGGPLGILIGGLLQRHARFRIPLCRRCDLRWDLGTLATLAATVLGLPLFPLLGGAGTSALLGEEALGAGILAGLLVWVVVLAWTRQLVEMRLKVRCVRIAGGSATLAFPHPRLVRAALRSVSE